MILAFLKGLFSLGTLKKVYDLLPFKAWLALFLAVVVSLKAGQWYGDGQGYTRGMEDCKNALVTVTPRPIELPPSQGQAEATPIEPMDTSAFHRRIQESIGLYRRSQMENMTTAQWYQKEIAVRDSAIIALSKEKEGRDTVAQGHMKVVFNPLKNFPNGYFDWSWFPNPVMAYDTSRTVVVPYSPNLIDLFVAVDAGGIFGKRGVAAMGRTGLDLNIGAFQLSGAIGVASERSKAFGLWTLGVKVSTK